MPTQIVPVTVLAIDGVPSQTPGPAFSIAASGGFGLPVEGAYYQVDDVTAAWSSAAGNPGGPFTASLPSQAEGLHFLFAFATDGQDSTSVNTGFQSSPLISNLAVMPFFVPSAAIPALQSISVVPATAPQPLR